MKQKPLGPRVGDVEVHNGKTLGGVETNQRTPRPYSESISLWLCPAVGLTSCGQNAGGQPGWYPEKQSRLDGEGIASCM